MKYLLCWIFPPLAILLCGKPVQAFLNLLLICTIIGIPFAVIWGYVTVAEFNAERRTKKVVRAIERGQRTRGRPSPFEDIDA